MKITSGYAGRHSRFTVFPDTTIEEGVIKAQEDRVQALTLENIPLMG
jgi:hypothetical protein